MHTEIPIKVLFVIIDGKADVVLLTTTYNHTEGSSSNNNINKFWRAGGMILVGEYIEDQDRGRFRLLDICFE